MFPFGTIRCTVWVKLNFNGKSIIYSEMTPTRRSILIFRSTVLIRRMAYERGSIRYISRVPESQEGVCESLKGPISVLFWIFLFFFFVRYFQLLLVYLENNNKKFTFINFERSLSMSPVSKSVLFRIAKFLLETLTRHTMTDCYYG
jgi:hypothetical protein